MNIIASTLAVLFLNTPATALAMHPKCPTSFSYLFERLLNLGRPNVEKLSETKVAEEVRFGVALIKIIESGSWQDNLFWIRQAHTAQVSYCIAHNEMVERTGGLLLLPLDHDYIGEQYPGKSVYTHNRALANPVLARVPVTYFSENELRHAHVNFRAGRAYRDDGTMLKSLGSFEYILDEAGEVYVMPAYDKRGDHITLKHSSLSDGKPVAAAGSITFGSDGSIERISNHSGHYKPTSLHQRQFIEKLLSVGMSLENTEIN